MRINNVRNGVYSDPSVPGKRNESTEAADQGLLQSLSSVSETATGTNSALREIAAQYDVTDITPREFSEMLGKMHDKGLISDDEFKELSLIRTDLEGDQIDADASIDLVDYYANKLRKQPNESDASNSSKSVHGVEALKQRLAWLEKFSLIQSAPDQIGLDAVA